MANCFDSPICPEGNECILTMAFVNMQPLNEIYEPYTAFKNGTLFPDLNKPFLAGGNMQ